ncbi:hypothetical protein A2V54_03620 [candidate division WWE3 bacterium RBG_19FT_COMBO_53_11]|uniref:Queuosine 5'-phosphate N-glycosylase/hydrolase n=1 Tax=candidate division WWE3 bacterium RBG_19FT_COMBO_53_11 TaxID=1802613 RepID=A0A1F4UIR2_UNCKA|nr:MAG: hypothetical protein A2155_00660 [candidate division WWE3 bacterium RBG_16_52_45]OGC44854.1 MAG: hypothetical protein A2V54_03620 [candidate division WWE3 bacterium RBG_19FT_COMBO_53_11]
MNDPLGVLGSTRYFLRMGVVGIDHSSVSAVAKTITPEDLTHLAKPLFFFEGWTWEEKVAITLIRNAVNFSFWPDHNEPRWTVHGMENKILDGSTAAYFCLEKAARQGWVSPLYFQDLSRIDKDELAQIFQGDGGSEIPLLPERLNCLDELGRGLQVKGSGGIEELLATTGWSAPGLARYLIQKIPNFNDAVDCWGDGETVKFHKRAQLAVSEIHRIMLDEHRGGFADVGDLTALSDYRIPQLFREMGILVYHEDLAEMVDGEEEVPLNSVAEICIRAATIWGAEYLRQELEKRLKQAVTAAQLDYVLWRKARELKDSMRPHHRTRTIAY